MTDLPTAQPADASDDVRTLAQITDAVVAAARAATDEVTDRTVIVAIDGRSGAGKTSLAQLVAERLAAPVVHMDDIYPGWDGLAAALPVLADEVLIPLRSGDSGVFRRWDWAAGEHGGELEVPVAPFVVVEGCGSSVGPAGQLADLRVWLDADTEQRRARGLTRDAGSFDEQWDSWAQQEDELFEADQTREHADLVFDTTDIAATD